MKKTIAILLTTMFLIALAACSQSPAETTVVPEIPSTPNTTIAPTAEPVKEQITEPVITTAPETEPPTEPFVGGLVGISIRSEFFYGKRFGIEQMESRLKDIGYDVEVQSYENDYELQLTQLGEMIDHGAKVIVLMPYGGEEYSEILSRGKEAGVQFFAYDGYCEGCTASIQFDIYSNEGSMLGQYIIDTLDLEHADDKTYYIEFAAGDAYDEQDAFIFDSAMNKLKPYLNSGTLVCLSGEMTHGQVSTEGYLPENAEKRFKKLLTTYYQDQQLDAILVTHDIVSLGVANALSSSYVNETYPILTGAFDSIDNVKNIINGKQSMTLHYSYESLAELTVDRVEHAMRGSAAVMDGYCGPVICTKDNLEETVIDSGCYSREELFDD